MAAFDPAISDRKPERSANPVRPADPERSLPPHPRPNANEDTSLTCKSGIRYDRRREWSPNYRCSKRLPDLSHHHHHLSHHHRPAITITLGVPSPRPLSVIGHRSETTRGKMEICSKNDKPYHIRAGLEGTRQTISGDTKAEK